MGTSSWAVDMAYNREAARLHGELLRAWNDISAAIRQMYPSTGIKPISAADIFSPVGNSEDPKFMSKVHEALRRAEVAGTWRGLCRSDMSRPFSRSEVV